MNKHAQKAALALVSALAACAVAELGLRAVVPDPESMPKRGPRLPWLVYHERFGWINQPGFSGRHSKQGCFDVAVNINAHGLRGRDIPYDRDPALRRILVLGDSFTFGHGVEDGETYAAQLERLMPGAEVLNSGVMATGHDQQMLWLREEGVRYSPEIVVWGWSSADIPRNTAMFRRPWTPNAGMDLAKPRFVLEGTRLTLTNSPTPPPGELDAAVREVRRGEMESGPLLVRPLRRLRVWRLAEQAVRVLYDKWDQIRVSQAILEETIRFARDRRLRLVVVHLPVEKWLVRRDPVVRLKRRITRGILTRALRGSGVEFLDLEPVFGKLGREGVRRLFIPDDGHYSPEGHAVVAGALREALAGAPCSAPGAAAPAVEPAAR